jgi:tetratricopeptide (TPR) repeat protein
MSEVMMHVAATSRWLLAAFVVAVTLALSLPVSAQSTGMVKGKVVDGQGQPVESAKILIEFLDGVNRKYDVKTNKRGEYIQIGLQPGNYRVTASKEGVGSQAFDARVRLGAAAEVNFQLVPGQGTMSKEDAEKFAAFKKVFEAGVAASTSGSYDEAIARFTEAETLVPECYACKFNIGGAYFQKKDYDKAEELYKAAAAMKPDLAEPYNALANLYNAQRKFDLAAQMTEEATKRSSVLGASGGGDADSLFNQGVIFWNAGKIADAKHQFEEALKIKPDHADAHYWVGMASLNEGKVNDAIPHFEEYLKLAPTGQYAKDVTNALAALKK